MPIIFLTAADSEQRNSYRGYAAGGADYIAKPFDPWILRAKVQVFVDLWAAGRRLATQATLLRRQIDEHEGARRARAAGRQVAAWRRPSTRSSSRSRPVSSTSIVRDRGVRATGGRAA